MTIPLTTRDLLFSFLAQNCRSATTQFWYRVDVSTNTWNNPYDSNGMNIEMWCEMQKQINTTAFPTDLHPTVPTGFKLADASPPLAGSTAATLVVATFTLFVATLLGLYWL